MSKASTISKKRVRFGRYSIGEAGRVQLCRRMQLSVGKPTPALAEPLHHSWLVRSQNGSAAPAHKWAQARLVLLTGQSTATCCCVNDLY